ncbi:NADH dehydrogenase [Gracilibacillus boraciitolerans JCM 21714]|uniref:NADH dehydrogenase n=1 Tax=Gracilibacillus boraciitolerans JCM 21714 TaxID=1298598 RepID=W4VKU7_9BACI|nr:NADH dehydrogenase [Gracilibacillus boraciitolerans JCM 21714]
MDTIMPGFDPELIEYAMNSLEARGVEFKLGAFLKEVRADGITFEQNGEKQDISALTTIWSAGVRANHLVEESSLEDNRGKVEVTPPELRAPSHDNVFVVGDCALIWNKEIDRPYPPTAQIAMQEAEICAHNLVALVKGGDLEHFEFINRGTVCSLGDDDGMGSIFGGKKIYGWTASFMKKVIDNRALLKIGGMGLLLKKGKFNIFK